LRRARQALPGSVALRRGTDDHVLDRDRGRRVLQHPRGVQRPGADLPRGCRGDVARGIPRDRAPRVLQLARMAEQQSLSRRKFLTYAGIGVAGLAATGAAVKIVSDQLATQDETTGDGGSALPTEIRNDKCLWGAYVDPGTGSAIGAVES